MPDFNHLRDILEKLLHRRRGRMTQELERVKISPHLPQIPDRMKPDATTASVCGYCSTGCSLKIHLRDGEAVNISPHNRYPVNQGMACPKGWEALTVLEHPSRGTQPLIRRDEHTFRPATWDEATDTFVRKFRSIMQAHGRESVAWLSTGQITNEEMAYIGALAKFGFGWIHGDGNTRQCMATAVTAYKESFGFDAPPFSYRDFEESDVIVLIGSNLCIAHPILWQRIQQNRRNPKIIVIDPRRTETAQLASLHLPIRPKSDLSFFYGLANVLIQSGGTDEAFVRAHTRGYDDYAAHVSAYSIEETARQSGISVQQIHELAQIILRHDRVSFWWTMGVNQGHQSTRTAQSIINLALLTGNIGRPGTGANSITGQCNAMGSRLFSNTTSMLAGHDFLNAQHRSKIARRLGISPDSIPAQNSLAYDQILEGIRDGKVRGLWVIATNPAHSWIHQSDAKTLLRKLDFLVVQDMYHDTHTAKLADLYLPAAAWGEKTGTFINSERRIGIIRKVKSPPGEALTDFEIAQKIAAKWGCDNRFSEWKDPESVFHILRDLSVDRPCDISGIAGFDEIQKMGGIQWPFLSQYKPRPDCDGRRLFEDGRFYHDDRKARFIWEHPQDMPEPPDEAFPFLLLTGRGSSAQWHTQTRTEKSAILKKLYPHQPYAEMNPVDASRLGLNDGQWAVVASRRGNLTARIRVSANLAPRSIFIPMHYPETNQLTHPSFDTHSRQPSYKACAVNVQPRDRKQS